VLLDNGILPSVDLPQNTFELKEDGIIPQYLERRLRNLTLPAWRRAIVFIPHGCISPMLAGGPNARSSRTAESRWRGPRVRTPAVDTHAAAKDRSSHSITIAESLLFLGL